jgi:hypothetical protein
MITKDQLHSMTLQELMDLKSNLDNIIRQRAKALGLHKWAASKGTNVGVPKTIRSSGQPNEAWPFG